jgi:hypothetical protein
MSVRAILPGINILSGQGAMALHGSNIFLPGQVSISRGMITQNSLANIVFYGLSDMYGAASIHIGTVNESLLLNHQLVCTNIILNIVVVLIMFVCTQIIILL